MSSKADLARRQAEKAAKKKAEEEARLLRSASHGNDSIITIPESSSANPEGSSAVPADEFVDDSNKRRNTDGPVQTYRPSWSILSTDKFAAPAPEEVKQVSEDILHAMILPADRSSYDSADPITACSELLGHFTMAGPWAAAVMDKVKDMTKQLKEAESLQLRVNNLMIERDALGVERDNLKKLVNRRTEQAKRTRRLLKKSEKKMIQCEDRSYGAGFDEAVVRVHQQGWDYKQILGMFEDPITRLPEPDLPLEVNSGSEPELSD